MVARFGDQHYPKLELVGVSDADGRALGRYLYNSLLSCRGQVQWTKGRPRRRLLWCLRGVQIDQAETKSGHSQDSTLLFLLPDERHQSLEPGRVL